MPVYICELCNFSTKIKTHYERHLNTKKHRVKDGMDEEEVVIFQSGAKKSQKEPILEKKEPKEPAKKFQKCEGNGCWDGNWVWLADSHHVHF